MSEANDSVEVVREVFEAVARRDRARVLALYDDDVELDPRRLNIVGLSGPGDGIYRGHEGVRHFYSDWTEAWEGVSYGYDELIDAGPRDAISIVTQKGRGKTSGIELDLPLAVRWTVRHGKVIRVEWFSSREAALEAVGLSE